MTGKRAFTLIELLVVISIIAVLLAILMPSLRAAKACAMRVVSTSNMRQIGLAIYMYAEDNRGSFPLTSHGGNASRSWIYSLESYLGDMDKVRICPADPKRQERLENNGSSYVLNEYIAVVPVDPFGRVIGQNYTNKHRLRRPAGTISTFVGADDLKTNVTADHTHSRSWFADQSSDTWARICTDIQPDRYRSSSQAEDKTKGSSIYLYADDHVEVIKAEVIKGMADIFENFAKPAN